MTDSKKPVAYLEGNEIYFDDEGDINDYIRQNGTPLYTHPASANVPEASKYVRADIHDEILEKQAKAAIAGMDAAKLAASKMEKEAKRFYAECNPQALESEREANAILTEYIAELGPQNAALAAHVDRLREAANYALAQWVVAEDGECEGYNKIADALAEMPTTSLARRDALNKVEGMDWVLAQSCNEENEGRLWRTRIVEPEIQRLRQQAEQC
jgi:cellobiose-specific phosphotransferase system component IIB